MLTITGGLLFLILGAGYFYSLVTSASVKTEEQRYAQVDRSANQLKAMVLEMQSVEKNFLLNPTLEMIDQIVVQEALVGPLLYAFSQEDPGCAARLIKEHAKDNDKLDVKFVSIGGEMLPGSDLARLASLPTKDQAISQLMSVMKAPVEKFVRTLAEPHAKLTRTIAAIKDQKAA